MDTSTVSWSAELGLSDDLRSMAAARRFVQTTLTERDYQGRVDDVVLCVSEIVANAVQHGEGVPRLRLSGTPWRLRVEVSDQSEAAPVRRLGLDNGWGLAVVDEIAIAWGADHRPGGKTVWCEIDALPAAR